jgi:hypothetical protein
MCAAAYNCYDWIPSTLIFEEFSYRCGISSIPKAGARSKRAPAIIPTSNPETKLADPVQSASGDTLVSFEVRRTASDTEVRKVCPLVSGFRRIVDD